MDLLLGQTKLSLETLRPRGGSFRQWRSGSTVLHHQASHSGMSESVGRVLFELREPWFWFRRSSSVLHDIV